MAIQMADVEDHGLWEHALPALEAVQVVTEAENFGGDPASRERLRENMAYALSYIHDGVQDLETRVGLGHLASARDVVEQILEDLREAHEAGAIQVEVYARAFGACFRLCAKLHDFLFVLPDFTPETLRVMRPHA